MASDREKDLIRERVSLVEVISSYTQLKKSGNRYAGLCPFHSDKDPSFSVDDERRLWHCFGCKRGGDVFAFVMEADNVDFGQAVELLARRAGIQLTDGFKGDTGQRDKKDRVRAVNELASKYFFKVLTSSKFGEKFLKYLDDRGVTHEQIKSFRLGACFESWDKLITTLGGKGFQPQELALAGLAIHKPERNSYYDRFRNRLMFPLVNVVGDVVGFAGRAWGDDMPKYLNTPETPLFSKSKLLYGLDRAKKNASENGIIITEGYMDVIALHRAGLDTAVASMGTALTKSHVDMIRRYTRKVALSYDSDFAGDSASMRGIEMLVESEFDVRVVSLPEGDDPDSLVRKGGGAEFQKYLDGAKDYFDFFMEHRIRQIGAETATQKSDVIKAMTRLIRLSPNEILRDEQVERMANRLGVTRKQAQSVMSRAKERIATGGGSAGAALDAAVIEGGSKVEKEILEALFLSRTSAEKVLSALETDDFSQKRHKVVFAYCAEYMRKTGGFDPNGFLNETHPPEVMALISGLALTGRPDAESEEKLLDSKLATFRKELLDREIAVLKRELEETAKVGDREKETHLLSRLSVLMKQKHG